MKTVIFLVLEDGFQLIIYVINIFINSYADG